MNIYKNIWILSERNKVKTGQLQRIYYINVTQKLYVEKEILLKGIYEIIPETFINNLDLDCFK
jgi:hypothetical protein